MPVKRAFIFGAGFSRPAGLPLANELLPRMIQRIELDEMQGWLESLRTRLEWLLGNGQASRRLNIEEVFHYAHFDAETFRLRQHLAPVGRGDGPGTPWNTAHSIESWLAVLEEALCDVILETDDAADLRPIQRWADAVNSHDTIATFNYDTLVERALSALGMPWNHATSSSGEQGIPVFKLHGSIDWMIAHRSEFLSKLDLLFDKENTNRRTSNTGHVEDDCRLWRCRTREQLRNWISGRDLQSIPQNAEPRRVGIAGLGAYKQLHQVPGLGRVWTRAMQAVYSADVVVVVGFSMSEFDAMAQMQFADVARARQTEGRPLKVIVIDPYPNEERFRRVFRAVEFVRAPHDQIDWTLYTAN